MKKRAFRGIVVLLLLAGVIYSAKIFIHSRTHESTDNAFVTGTIVPIAPEVRGRVVKVHIEDNVPVEAGQPLVEICRDDYINVLKQKEDAICRAKAEEQELKAAIHQRRETLAQARASLDAALAQEQLSEKELNRYKALQSQDVISQSQYDHVESQWKVAYAGRQAASASVDEAAAAIAALEARLATQEYKIKEAETGRNMAKLDLDRTIISAPVAGRVAMKKVDQGKYVQPGQPLLAIVKDETWVIANFKETQIKKMSVGQSVDLKVDAYPGVVFKGRIESLQPGTGSVFSLLPPENASGNFVKVVQRIPVKIIVDSPFDPDHPLWPGLSVRPVVDVGPKT